MSDVLVVAGLEIPRESIFIPDEGLDFIERAIFDRERLVGGKPIIGGGASSFPYEGLDMVLNDVLGRSGTAFPDPAYIGLFTSQTPATVPSQDAVLATGAGSSPVVEATGGGYARAAIAASNWPAPTTQGTGRRSQVVSPGISFAESTGAYSVPAVNGFFLASAATAGVALFYSNFVSGAAINVNQAGFVVRIPPYLQFNGA